MFQVGEKVFCPKRGSGQIEAIEKRTMLDEEKEYVIVNMIASNMTMMIPTERMSTSGFRKISNEEAANEVLEILAHKQYSVDLESVPKQRIKQYQEKLATGSFAKCGEVIRDLTLMGKEKSLSSSEKNVLQEARRLLIEEMILIKQISKEQANELIDEILA